MDNWSDQVSSSKQCKHSERILSMQVFDLSSLQPLQTIDLHFAP